jgi:trans-2,3-dihydro-3-hydroxyanthranilate isomerase
LRIVFYHGAMQHFAFITLDVFTTTRFGGNPLAVFPDARGLTGAQMQTIAREFNLSETSFVLPPQDPAHTAQVRIFTPAREMPFAGHPNVGTGWALADRARDGVLLFEEIAGLVEVRITRDAAAALESATIAAPQPLSLAESFTPAEVAPMASLAAADIITSAHAPLRASVGNPFILAEVSPEALAGAAPDIAASRLLIDSRPELAGRTGLYLYAHDGARLRTRMFAPPLGVLEDPATGSAATPLAALLLHLSGADHGAWDMLQGVEMGRPSLLRTTARRTADGIRATVGGACVEVMRGSLAIEAG